MVRVWEGVHGLIERVLKRYALENKVIYWLAFFRREVGEVIRK
jgi:hypothetical protein